MSLHFVCGLDGSGKTLYAMRLIEEELRNGNRHVVTNVAIRFPELNEYCQGCNVMERVRVISPEETQHFWRRRPQMWDVIPPDVEARKRGSIVLSDMSRCRRGNEECLTCDLPGVLFVIDEIHVFFGAREWAKTGLEARDYITQHRKMGRNSDDVIAITQVITQVDRAFRDMGKNFTYLTNLTDRMLLGFKLPSRFLTATYLRPPTGAASDLALMRSTFTIDAKGLAGCYDTAAGMGIVGGLADVGKRRKGLPFWLLPTGVVCLGLSVWGAVVLGMHAAAGAGKRMIQGAVPAISAAVPASLVARPEPASAPAPTQSAVAGRERVRRMTGFTCFDGEYRVTLDDGRVVRSSDSRMTYLDPETCVYGGQRYEMR